jgi:hypothetical protein
VGCAALEDANDGVATVSREGLDGIAADMMLICARGVDSKELNEMGFALDESIWLTCEATVGFADCNNVDDGGDDGDDGDDGVVGDDGIVGAACDAVLISTDDDKSVPGIVSTGLLTDVVVLAYIIAFTPFSGNTSADSTSRRSGKGIDKHDEVVNERGCLESDKFCVQAILISSFLRLISVSE